MIKETKTAVVSARLYPGTKRKLVASGYSAADVIEWFVHEYYSSKSAKKLKIRKEIIEQTIADLQKETELNMKKIKELELELSQLDTSKDIPEDDDSCNTDNVNIDDEIQLPQIIIEGISIAHNAYHRKKEKEWYNNIDEFMEENKEFMTNIWGNYAKNMDFEEFKGLVRERVEDDVYENSKHLRANP